MPRYEGRGALAAPACDHPRIRVAALLVMDGKVLLARHRKDGRTYHLLPGGGVETGETLSAALEREVAEETGLNIAVGRPLLLNDTIDPSGARHLVNITFEARITGGSVKRSPDDVRVEGLDLIDPADLVTLDLRPPIGPEIIAAVRHGDDFRTTYLGPRFSEEPAV